MTAFDPATAYTNDAQWHDFTEKAAYTPPDSSEVTVQSLDVKRGDLSDSDYRRAATGLQITSRSAGFVVWNDTDDTFEPLPDGLLRLDDNSGWIIRNAVRDRFGRWVLACEQERTDADS